jgi:hypothetical protein
MLLKSVHHFCHSLLVHRLSTGMLKGCRQPDHHVDQCVHLFQFPFFFSFRLEAIFEIARTSFILQYLDGVVENEKRSTDCTWNEDDIVN